MESYLFKKDRTYQNICSRNTELGFRNTGQVMLLNFFLNLQKLQIFNSKYRLKVGLHRELQKEILGQIYVNYQKSK